MTTNGSEALPDDVGDYRIVERLGQGGMADVYLAEQSEPVRRQVAVKMLKAGMDSKQVVARFESERQALAVLDHPNIAKIFDGGVAGNGRPYFVMEYVPGEPITEFCDAARLSLETRLRLFVDVCRAVQHAHLKGLIHRDLKPTNILVSRVDGRPQPKVIDFGVAKATETPLTDATLETRIGQVIGTPQYMSPEQIGLDEIDIDSRADIYSLGVVLYELLTSALPLDLTAVRDIALPSVIREKVPPTPSSRFTDLGQTRGDVAEARATTAQELNQSLKGDLDWIVMKAIEKDRGRRYETPNALAADCERYLLHQAVLARPPSAGYQFSRFVRRNRGLVAAASVALLALIGGSVAATVGYLRATAAEQTARQEAETAQQVSDFMVGLFESSDPASAQGAEVSAREVLDRGVESISADLDDQPLVQATLQTTMGSVYRTLQRLPEAERLFREAFETRRELLGPDHPDTLTSANWLGITVFEQSRFDEALEIDHDVLERRQRVLGNTHEDTLKTQHNIAVVHRFTGDLGKAESLFTELLETQLTALGEEHDLTLLTMLNLGQLYSQMGRQDDAAPILEDVARIREGLLGPDHPQTLNARNGLADLYLTIERFDNAVALYTDVLERRRRVLGPTHAQTLWTQDGLATTYAELGQQEEAEALMKDALAGLRAAYGDEHLTTLGTMTNLAEMYRMWERYEEAEPLYVQVHEDHTRLHPDATNTGIANHNLAALYSATDRHAEALPLFAEAERIWAELVPRDHIYRIENARRWAEARRAAGDEEGAAELEARLEELGVLPDYVNPRY